MRSSILNFQVNLFAKKYIPIDMNKNSKLTDLIYILLFDNIAERLIENLVL